MAKIIELYFGLNLLSKIFVAFLILLLQFILQYQCLIARPMNAYRDAVIDVHGRQRQLKIVQGEVRQLFKVMGKLQMAEQVINHLKKEDNFFELKIINTRFFETVVRPIKEKGCVVCGKCDFASFFDLLQTDKPGLSMVVKSFSLNKLGHSNFLSITMVLVYL